MSINFTIECRHCGAHTTIESYASCHTIRNMLNMPNVHVDTECVIRCPNCRSRLNRTEDEFRSQVTWSCES